MKCQSLSRRKFFKKAFFVTSSGVLASAFVSHPTYAEGPKRTLIDMSKPNDPNYAAAKAFNYVADLKKALKDGSFTTTEKSGVAPEKQTCDNCNLYNFEKKSPPEPTCQVLPNALVHPEGSCSVWVKKV